MNTSCLNLTPEQQFIFNTSHTAAMKHFGIEHGDNLVLHHVDDSLRHTDIERYIRWLPEDLVVMTPREHTALHRAESREPRHTTPHTEEAKKKMSESKKGKPHPHTEEQNAKISLSNSKPVICIETGITYINAQIAGETLSISDSGIRNCLCGKSKTSGGYHWKYL